MLLLKACRHCRRGDLIVGHEEDGPDATCLQCETSKVHLVKVLGVLSLPLIAVLAAVLFFAWGPSQSAQAAPGDAGFDTNVGGDPGKVAVEVGQKFDIQVIADGVPADPITGFSFLVTVDTGLKYNGTGNCASEVKVTPPLGLFALCIQTGNGTTTHGVDVGAELGVPPLAVIALSDGDPLANFSFTCNAVGSYTISVAGGYARAIDAAPIAAHSGGQDINCLPPGADINITVTNATDQSPLGGTCWAVSYEELQGSPPVLANVPFSNVCDNGAGDNDAAAGAIEIGISGADRAAFGDIWHVLNKSTDGKHDLDNTKYSCDLSQGKCIVNSNQAQSQGTITASFFLNDPVQGTVSLGSVDPGPFCVNLSPALESPYCTGGGGVNNVNTGLIAVGAYDVTFKGCPEGFETDDAKAPPLDTDTRNVVLGPGGDKQVAVEFHCRSSVLFNLKLPVLQNLFLTAQGAKLAPDTCASGTDAAVLTHQLSGAVTSTNPKGNAQVLSAFEFEVRFDEKMVCVNIERGAAADNMDCFIDDADEGLQPDGIARIGCVSKKDAPAPTSLELARILVQPQPELYSFIIANQSNGIVVQILNQDCNLSDQEGHPIAASGCPDSDVTVRWLEGDVNGDCVVDVIDQQNLSFRWGVEIGSLLYNARMDLEPSGQISGDGDIDIKDVQFVYGRHGSSCGSPNPPQPPVNATD